MNKTKFLSVFPTKSWSHLIEIPQVEAMIEEYTNKNTIFNIMRCLGYFLEEVHKSEPQFELSDLLKLSSKDARRKIYNVCQSILEYDKSRRTAQQVKMWLKVFYDYHNEQNPIIWKRHHVISSIPMRSDRYVPTHTDIFLICDHCMNLRDKSMVLLYYNTGLTNECLGNIKLRHIRGILEQYKEDKKLPLILKITSETYPKRFRSNNTSLRISSLIDRDCANLLLKYYEKHRRNAEDEEYFFISKTGTIMTTQRISVQIKNAIKKASEVNPKLKKSYPNLLRHSFYNRLVGGEMEDLYREYLMMHSTGIREHYFSSTYHKERVIQQYLKCSFNRGVELEKVERQIKALQQKEKKVNHLETEVTKLRKIVKGYEKLFKFELDGEKTDLRPKHLKTEEEPRAIKIGKSDMDKYIELVRKGYTKTMENHEYIVMEKT